MLKCYLNYKTRPIPSNARLETHSLTFLIIAFAVAYEVLTLYFHNNQFSSLVSVFKNLGLPSGYLDCFSTSFLWLKVLPDDNCQLFQQFFLKNNLFQLERLCYLQFQLKFFHCITISSKKILKCFPRFNSLNTKNL